MSQPSGAASPPPSQLDAIPGAWIKDVDTTLHPQTDSLLMALPPEMRNRIYHFALLEPDGVAVCNICAGVAAPDPLALLQIRKEASAIYYQENFFTFHIHDWGATCIIRWQRSFLNDRMLTNWILDPSYNDWPRLCAWLEEVFHDKEDLLDTPLPKPDEAEWELEAVAVHLLFMVGWMRRKTDVSWDNVYITIEMTRRALAFIDPAWRAEKSSTGNDFCVEIELSRPIVLLPRELHISMDITPRSVSWPRPWSMP
jgi:hypothetical protein